MTLTQAEHIKGFATDPTEVAIIRITGTDLVRIEGWANNIVNAIAQANPQVICYHLEVGVKHRWMTVK